MLINVDSFFGILKSSMVRVDSYLKQQQAANYPAHLRKTYHLGSLIRSSTPVIILEFVFNFSKQTENIRITWFFLQSTKDQLKNYIRSMTDQSVQFVANKIHKSIQHENMSIPLSSPQAEWKPENTFLIVPRSLQLPTNPIYNI